MKSYFEQIEGKENEIEPGVKTNIGKLYNLIQRAKRLLDVKDTTIVELGKRHGHGEEDYDDEVDKRMKII